MNRLPLHVGIVAGEESGDLLGADLVDALARATGREIRLTGLGGRHLQERGLVSLFDASEIAIMGLSAVIAGLPRLIGRIGTVANAVVAAKPDVLVTIDSPDFTLRVARKVRRQAPGIPIVHYVCPSVWAWRQSRAAAMRPYVDHVLCLLPFEPAELSRLSGPPGTYVGHRLAREERLARAAERQRARVPAAGARNLLVLPGSRRSEVSRLLEPFGRTVDILAQRGNRFEVVVPTVPHVSSLVEAATRRWSVPVRIVTDPDEKHAAFGEADAALAASGTVLLELALARVPMISCYRFDPMATMFMGLISVWSAALPNLVADWPIVPEAYNRYVRPEYLARMLEQIWDDTPMRRAQIAGFETVAGRLATDRPAGEIAAETVLSVLQAGSK